MSDGDSNLSPPENHKMRRKVVNRIEDSDDDEPREQKTENNQSRKRPFEKFRNTKRQKKARHDDENEDYEEGKSYKSKAEKVFDSDEDSDVEVTDLLTRDKESVLEFLNNAKNIELLLINNCSQKKADAIIAGRPYTGWKNLVKKLQNKSQLSTDLLNATQNLLNTRMVVKDVMSKCLDSAHNLEKAIEAGASTIKEQPKSLNPNFKLSPYQIVGLNWLNALHSQNFSGILADEMGLGKTIQIIAFLTYLKEANLLGEEDGPHVIVVPSSTIENWMNEFERWSPSMNVIKYYGSQDVRKQMRMSWRYNNELDDVDVIMTTYNTIANTPEERRLFRIMPITYLILDEAHMLKNMNTARYENLIRINSHNRILLTGTPLQNNLLELISLIVFVMPKMFVGKIDDLKSLFSKNPKLSSAESDKPIFEQEQINNAKKIMKPFFLRRLKSEVLKDLPTKSEEIIRCPMLPEQQEIYDKIFEKLRMNADEEESDRVGMLMKLRRAANHPLLTLKYYTEEKLKTIAKKLSAEPSYKQKNADYVYEELEWMTDFKIHQLSRTYKSLAGFGLPLNLIPESGKFRELDKLLPVLQRDGHRILLFSQFTMVLDIVQDFLTMKNYRYCRLDGQTPVLERQNLIDEFTNNSEIFIFLLSTKAGGQGINLSAADTVILHDIDYNPHNDKQAEDRSHRVGQNKPVRIIRLLSEGTIEEEMYKIAQEKLKLEEKISDNKIDNTEDRKNIAKLLKRVLGLDINKTSNQNSKKNGIHNSSHDDI